MTTCNNPAPLDRRGMTLIEMMVALSMFAVVMGVVFTFLGNSRRSYTSTSERANYQQSLRAVISLLTREIRSAGCDPTDVGFDRFAVADDRRMRVLMDLDGDGDTGDNNPDEDVTWQYLPVPMELQRNGGLGAQTVLRNVTDVSFAFFDEDGAALAGTPLSAADRELVRYVDISLTGESGTGEEVSYRTRILIRND